MTQRIAQEIIPDPLDGAASRAGVVAAAYAAALGQGIQVIGPVNVAGRIV